MAKMNLKEIAVIMKHIDICMMTTMTAEGTHTSRPMSNNREVEYKGDSYFFTKEEFSCVQDIKMNSQVNLAYVGHHSIINRSSIYISLEGKADLIRDKAEFKKHWVKDLEVWFENGVDTPGLVLVKVKGSRIKYWDGKEEGEISI